MSSMEQLIVLLAQNVARKRARMDGNLFLTDAGTFGGGAALLRGCTQAVFTLSSD